MKRGPNQRLHDHQRFTIEEVAEDGKPIAPEKNVQKFVAQCGVFVRTIPITIREWHKPKADGVSYVDDRSKEVLWNKLMTNFTLPPEVDAENPVIARKVKAWALKKMAQQFCNYKKRLHTDFILGKKPLKFEGAYEKIKDQWPDFVK